MIPTKILDFRFQVSVMSLLSLIIKEDCTISELKYRKKKLRHDLSMKFKNKPFSISFKIVDCSFKIISTSVQYTQV